ncbi:MAG: glycosyltransferase family 4 protein [Candidatus Methanomethylicaceae archaeon]
MMEKTRVLYIQHAGALGGSVYSLAYLIKGINRERYEPIVVCIHDNPEIRAVYESMGVETNVCRGISIFPHTTGGWYSMFDPLGIVGLFKAAWKFIPSIKETEEAVRRIKPDIVHLNSLVLSPSAVGVKRVGLPLVWHVRESVARGHLGLRKWLLSRLVNRKADEIVFISEYDRQALLGNRRGIVVPNFVDEDKFNPQVGGETVRRELSLADEDKVILFMGGRSVVNGIFPLLKAIPLIKARISRTRCVILGAIYEQSNGLLARSARKILPKFGHGTLSQRVDQTISDLKIADNLILLPWRSDVERLIAACDVVVFPSIEPHFARPVIEAGTMGKPVVASRIGGVEELVDDGVTGILVTPGDHVALADALVRVLSDEGLARRMGEEGRKRALERYSMKNVKRVEEIYERLLKDG